VSESITLVQGDLHKDFQLGFWRVGKIYRYLSPTTLGSGGMQF
jgi:hypothetical protein